MNLIPAKAKKNGKGTKFVIERNTGKPLTLYDENITKLPENIVLGLRPDGYRRFKVEEGAQISSDTVNQPSRILTFL